MKKKIKYITPRFTKVELIPFLAKPKEISPKGNGGYYFSYQSK